MNDEIDISSIPPSFRYRKVYEKGKPVHNADDLFSIRHPAMALSKRAKIFNPFDALKGFGDELSKAEEEAGTLFMPDVSTHAEDYPQVKKSAVTKENNIISKNVE